MKPIVLGLFCLFMPLLNSCAGFQPVYAVNGTVRTSLSQVQVQQIQGRNGFNLIQELYDRGNIRQGESGPYQLVIKLAPSRLGSGVRIDNVATRFEIQMVANWKLLDSSGSILEKMTASATSSFDSPASPYASQVAEQNAEDRAIAMLADTVLDQLGFYFASRQSR